MVRCMGCMGNIEEGIASCPLCGFETNQYVEDADYLPPGSILLGRYIVGKALGHGGFGITYLGWDEKILRKVAIKEYFPSVSAGFSTGLDYSYKNGFNLSDGRVSINASIPLDFWATANSVQKSKIAQQQSALDFEDTINRFDISVQTGILDCIAQAATVISSQKALEYAEKHYESIWELYRLSQNSISDLSNASILVNSNRNQLISAQYNFLSRLSEIRSLGAFENDQDVIDLLLGISR